MLRTWGLTLLMCLLSGSFCLAQSSGQDQDGDTLAANPPLENASGSQVRSRAPGTWVSAARSRHNEVMTNRLRSARFGEENPEAAMRAGGGGTTSGGSSGGLGGLLNLIGGSSGTTGGLGSLGSLLGGGGGTSTGGSSVGTQGATSSGGTQYTIQDLLDLRDSMGGGTQQVRSDVAPSSKQSATSLEFGAQTQNFGGAIGRLPKYPVDRMQQQQQEERKFRTRLLDSLLQTMFTALTFGFSSNDFVDAIKDGLRPVFYPPVDDGTDDGTDDGNSDGNGGDDGSDGGDDGSDGGDDTGGGIDDIDPPSDNDDDSGSVI